MEMEPAFIASEKLTLVAEKPGRVNAFSTKQLNSSNFSKLTHDVAEKKIIAFGLTLAIARPSFSSKKHNPSMHSIKNLVIKLTLTDYTV